MEYRNAPDVPLRNGYSLMIRFLLSCNAIQEKKENLDPFISHKMLTWMGTLIIINDLVRTEDEINDFYEKLNEFCNAWELLEITQLELLNIRRTYFGTRSKVPLGERKNQNNF